jgi:hypothetical protein
MTVSLWPQKVVFTPQWLAILADGDHAMILVDLKTVQFFTSSKGESK